MHDACNCIQIPYRHLAYVQSVMVVRNESAHSGVYLVIQSTHEQGFIGITFVYSSAINRTWLSWLIKVYWLLISVIASSLQMHGASQDSTTFRHGHIHPRFAFMNDMLSTLIYTHIVFNNQASRPRVFLGMVQNFTFTDCYFSAYNIEKLGMGLRTRLMNYGHLL